MPVGVDRIETWADIVTQIGLFFRGGSLISADVIKAVRGDPSFKACNWSKEKIETLLRPIEVHVEASNVLRNRCEEALSCINREWGTEASVYIRSQAHTERTLKLIASVALRRDVEDLQTGLLLANTQAVRRITEGKTFFSRRLYLTSDDWKQCKNLPVPSRDLYIEELTMAGVHINSAGEIQPGRPLISFPLPHDDGCLPPPHDEDFDSSSEEGDVVGGRSGDVGGGKCGGGHGTCEDSGSDTRSGDGDETTVVNPGKKSTKAAPDSGKITLHRWLRCSDCSGLHLRWCEDVLCSQRIDLVGGLGILGAYYYTPLRLCEIHLPLLIQAVQLKIDDSHALHHRLNSLWENTLSINHLAGLVDKHRDWFVSSVVFSRSAAATNKDTDGDGDGVGGSGDGDSEGEGGSVGEGRNGYERDW